jgi:diguanylate cyclase (GGDEF)-like protein
VLAHANGAAAHVVARRLRAETELRLTQVVGRTVTVSIGIAVGTAGEFDARSLLRSADEALYAAKRSGRNQIVLWSDAPSEEAV